MRVDLRWEDVRGLKRFSEAIRALGNDESRKALNRALNRTGEMAKTKVRRALTKQTGLQAKVVTKALKVRRSSWEKLTYSIEGEGGNISLKYFKPSETDAGVVASPFGRKAVFAATFLKGGAWPNRLASGAFVANGHAMYRTGPARMPIARAKSGVVIPNEMVQGASAAAFEETAAEVLPRRIEHEVKRATKGVVS
ncbi:phage tail protein [Aureimonas ureilytica]|uniref:phage tail protein n=1 Tax=Aureimonas ureilytica TaxID=401562 RepID=UPI000477CB39|nr:phage tail protein [Aureimonas ureilytica]